jgi:hypothetical protein
MKNMPFCVQLCISSLANVFKNWTAFIIFNVFLFGTQEFFYKFQESHCHKLLNIRTSPYIWLSAFFDGLIDLIHGRAYMREGLYTDDI